MSAVCRLQRVAFKASEKNRGKVAPNICLGVSSCWWKAEWTGNRSEGDTHHPHYRERVKHEFDDNTQAFPSEPVCVEHPMSRNLGGWSWLHQGEVVWHAVSSGPGSKSYEVVLQDKSKSS